VIFTKLHRQVGTGPEKNWLDFQGHGFKSQGPAATTTKISLDLSLSISRFICLSVCNAPTFESFDLESSFLVCRSFSYIKVIGSRLRLQEPKVLLLTAYGPENFTLPSRIPSACVYDVVMSLLACMYTGPYLREVCGFNPPKCWTIFCTLKTFAIPHASVDALYSMTRSFWNAPMLRPADTIPSSWWWLPSTPALGLLGLAYPRPLIFRPIWAKKSPSYSPASRPTSSE